VNLLGNDPYAQNWGQGFTDGTGLGLAMECVAHSMKWINNDEIKDRVLLTLNSLAGKT